MMVLLVSLGKMHYDIISEQQLGMVHLYPQKQEELSDIC